VQEIHGQAITTDPEIVRVVPENIGRRRGKIEGRGVDENVVFRHEHEIFRHGFQPSQDLAKHLKDPTLSRKADVVAEIGDGFNGDAGDGKISKR
jgi:hypothetical protein